MAHIHLPSPIGRQSPGDAGNDIRSIDAILLSERFVVRDGNMERELLKAKRKSE